MSKLSPNLPPQAPSTVHGLGTYPEPVEASGLEGDNNDRVLSAEEQEYNEWAAQRQEFTDAALEVLNRSHPEFFDGRVPEQFEEMLHKAGYERYAVGFNQSDAIDTAEGAKELLTEQGGIEVDFYNLGQRFLIHDQESPSPFYPIGYYGPQIGRFVYVFPVDTAASEPARVEAAHADFE